MQIVRSKSVATQVSTENIFEEAVQLSQPHVSLEIKTTGTDAATKATLMTSASGKNFSQPHEDAVIDIEAGDQVVNVAFEGLTPGTFVEVHFDKQTATVGTFDATLV